MASSKKEYSLGFVIGAQLKSSFSSSFKGAEKQLLAAQKAAKNCGAAWKEFGQNAGKLVLGVTGAAAGIATAAWKMTDSVAVAGDAAAKDAAKLHMETEALQELQYAFGQAGVGSDEFTSMVTKMNNTLAKAAKDDDTAKKMAEFGLSAQKLASMTPEQALLRLSDYMGQIEDSAERSRLSMELFGNSGGAMEQAMLQGSDSIQKLREEARSTGWVISEEAARQAEAYGDAKDRLTKSVEGMRRQLFGPMMGGFTQAFTSVSDKMAEHQPKIQEFGALLGQKLAESIPKIAQAARHVGDFIGKVHNGVLAVKDFVGGWKNVGIIVAALASFKTAASGVSAVISTVTMLRKGMGLLKAMFPALGKVGLASLGPILPIVLGVAAAAFVVYKNWDKLKSLFSQIFQSLKSGWDRIWPTLQSAAARIGPAIEKVGDMIAQLISFAMPLIQNGLEFIVDCVEAAVGLIGPFFDFIGSVATFVIDLISGNWSALGDDLLGIISSVGNFFKSALDAGANLAKKWVGKVLDFFSPITDFFGGVGEKIKGMFSFGGKSGSVSIPAHGTGGIFTAPHFAQIAEAGDAEAVVPINSNPRSRSIWETAGRMAGFLPDDSGDGVSTPSIASASKLAALAPAGTGGAGFGDLSIHMPVTVQGDATAETIQRLKEAGIEITEKVREIVLKVLAEIDRNNNRVRF